MTPADQSIIDAAQLPVPRLQLRWEKTDWAVDDCVYELVIPVHADDIRNAGDGVTVRELGRTHVDSGGRILKRNHRTGRRLLRDAAHAAWDSHVLNLPAYAVDDERAARIPPCPHPSGQRD